ncbi:MAG: phosphoribosylanthranilate isomerase [Kiritimatiellae bacterium]|nr:phosphoribosylanthranilate isomerase [Kiritimatiellia bacterium]
MLKICGMTSAKFASAAEQLGIDFLGFIFYPPSPRHLTDEKAVHIANSLSGRAKRVGVFVFSPLDEILAKAASLHLSIVQLHGDYAPAVASKLQENGLEVWKTIHSAQDLQPNYPCDGFLVDAKVQGMVGGTGLRSDWSLISKIRETGRKSILAGGISPENLAEAMQSGADILDLNSSLESPKGVKSLARLAILAEKLRSLA